MRSVPPFFLSVLIRVSFHSPLVSLHRQDSDVSFCPASDRSVLKIYICIKKQSQQMEQIHWTNQNGKNESSAKRGKLDTGVRRRIKCVGQVTKLV